MIRFKQKSYSEADAMRYLVTELQRRRIQIEIIDRSSLIPILKGNNVVIEKFVISSSLFGRDKYRLYLKVGARAKMPDEVRLPAQYYEKNHLFKEATLKMSAGVMYPNNDGQQQQQKHGGQQQQGQNNGRQQQRGHSDVSLESLDRFFSELSFKEKSFAKGGKGGNNNNGPKGPISVSLIPNIDLSYDIQKLLGEAILYDKTSRSLVLEFETVDDAIRALNILPFGLNYKLYLLDA